ncbi:MAG TPA: translation initiation factor IF-3, partial [Methylocystis sp.]
MKSTAAPQKEGLRINKEIRAREVRLIDSEGKNHGVVP